MLTKRGALLTQFKFCSDWQRARSAIAVCLKYRERLLKKVKSNLTISEDNKSCERQQIRTVEHLQKADIEIYKFVQMVHFEADVKALKINIKKMEDNLPKDSAIPPKHSIKKSSLLYRLNPFCDPHGILRVGGRIKHATLPRDVKFQSFFPKAIT